MNHDFQPVKREIEKAKCDFEANGSKATKLWLGPQQREAFRVCLSLMKQGGEIDADVSWADILDGKRLSWGLKLCPLATDGVVVKADAPSKA